MDLEPSVVRPGRSVPLPSRSQPAPCGFASHAHRHVPMDDEAPHATAISPFHRASSGRSPKTLQRDKRREARLPSYRRHEVAARQGSSRVDVSEPRGRSSARRSIGLLPKRLRNGKTSSFSEPRRTLRCLRSRHRTRLGNRRRNCECACPCAHADGDRGTEWCGRAGSRLAGYAFFVAVERARPGQVKLRADERARSDRSPS